jgi:hypothetical protein
MNIDTKPTRGAGNGGQKNNGPHHKIIGQAQRICELTGTTCFECPRPDCQLPNRECI